MANFVFMKCTLLATIVAFSVSSAAAPSGTESTISSAAAESPTLKILKLQRTSVVLPKSFERAGKRKNFYSAKLSVGRPAQQFQVSFDLGGGTMVLPASTCHDPACLERRRYDKWASETAEDIQADGRLVQPRMRRTLISRRDRGTLGIDSIDLGYGKVRGTFIRDEVCVLGDDSSKADNAPRCFPLALLSASNMSALPFTMEPYDGTVGLGLKGMSLSMEFNFLAAFKQGYSDGFPTNSFGLHIGMDEDGGEITFGGYDMRRLTHPLKWTNVAAAEEGRWQVDITSIRIGNTTLELCRDRVCRAALDYSSSLLAVPPGISSKLENTLSRLATREGFGDGCQHVSLPDISLQLAGDVSIVLPAEDYVDDFRGKKALLARPSCEPLLVHNHADVNIGQDVFILGESTLRRYYTMFDADSLKVGFSLAASTRNQELLSNGETPQVSGKGKTTSESPVIVLVQVKVWKARTLAPVSL